MSILQNSILLGSSKANLTSASAVKQPPIHAHEEMSESNLALVVREAKSLEHAEELLFVHIYNLKNAYQHHFALNLKIEVAKITKIEADNAAEVVDLMRAKCAELQSQIAILKRKLNN